MAARTKFATQIDPALLEQTRAIAAAEGRQIQSVVEEALNDLVEKRRQSKPRPLVMAHYEASVAQFGPLHERLSK